MFQMSVEDQGTLQAEILVVGEAPGPNSAKWGKPFGAYQHELRYWWRLAGIDPRDLYLTYVYKRVPFSKKHDLGLAVKSGKVTQQSIFAGQDTLVELASRMPNLKIIVPMGDFSMSTFTPYGKCQTNPMATASHKQTRGSVYNWETKDGRDVKVIGTHAPHQVQSQSQLTFRTLDDWKRIHEQRSTPFPFEAPERKHNIHPSLDECYEFRDRLTKGDVVSIDIETWGNELKCIGFSTDEKDSLVIPTTKPHIGSAPFGSLSEWWQVIYDICSSPAETLAQNGLFDAWWLREYGIPMQNYWWDTLAMHHCLNSLDSHSLEYMTSVLTLQPYYKDEAKEADEIVKVAKSGGMDKLYVYNGLDVLVTHEVFQKLYDQLEERGMLEFYLRHYADMNEPLLGMMRGGVPVNRQTVESERIRLMDEAVLHRDKASIIAGKPMWTFKATKCERDMLELYWNTLEQHRAPAQQAMTGTLFEMGHKQETIDRKWLDMQNKGVSDVMLTEVLYKDWKCPSGKQTESGRDKADNIALKGLQNLVKPRKRVPRGYEGPVEEWVSNVVGLVDETLASRRAKKLSSFVDPKKVDPDDRLRCSYKYTTKTGRLASASNPRGTGMNLQNIDRAMRHPFEATQGRLLMECDGSQAEGRVVKGLTGDPDMIWLARRLPTEGDEHTENAAAIFGITFEEVTKEQRYIGKRAVHATNYGMRGQTLSDQLLKEGYVYTPKECQAMIDAYAAKFPALREWQSTVRRTMLRKQRLFTSWGRSVSFKHLALDDELFRFGYSFVPQSEIGDLLNQYGLKPLHNYIQRYKMQSEIVLQVHDSVVLNAVPEEMYDLMCFLKESIEQPRTYGEVYGVEEEIIIPAEFGIGKTWKKAVEWKGFPTKEEVNETVAELLAA